MDEPQDMIRTTRAAAGEILRQLDGKPYDIRIHYQGAGWAGPRLGLALDEPEDDDLKVESGGIRFLVKPLLAEMFGPFTVELDYHGLSVYSRDATGGGGACSL